MLDDTITTTTNSSTVQATLPPYLSALNPEQQSAVQAVDGPVLVLAGAGTGKTRVLTTRIAHIIMQGKAFPGQILAVTFTNKAANEMKERVEKLLHHGDEDTPPTASGTWLGTFHSIGAKILRRHAELIGFSQDFTILDADDQIRLLKQIISEQNIDNQRYPAKLLMSVIQSWKDKGLTPEKLDAAHSEDGTGGLAYRLYPIYQHRLKTLNAMDFGDLLLHCLSLFTEHQHILNEYTHRFKYILVDEYQDTNIAQYLWLRLLSIGHKNICCVGDDDQSIYGWRGAEVGNILKFEKDYPEAKIIRLERNYRSTPHILAAASGLIAHNKGRMGKTLWTDESDGELVRIKSIWDDGEEARFVGEEIEAFQRDGISLDEMAVLVRAGYQTRSFEERFITLGVPYRVIGGLRFYERMEVRDAVAYLRVIAQPNDDLAFERIVNTPKRGIGKATLEKLHATARANNTSLYKAIEMMLESGELKGKSATTLQQLLGKFDHWRLQSQELPLPELADNVLDESGYRAMWEQDKSPEAPGRLENLRELIRALGEFPKVQDFLEHVGLVMDTAGTEASTEMVNIMSLHAAKGLEFDVAFLTGWEEGLFPSQRTMDEKGTTGLEEERRLAYVGITRAKQYCIISHAANRRIYNQWQSSIPSRFLGELPEDHIEMLDGGPAGGRAKGPELFRKEVEDIFSNAVSATSADDDAPTFKKGQRVFHQKFGYGIVIIIEGDHLTIAFKHAGKKKVMADYIQAA